MRTYLALVLFLTAFIGCRSTEKPLPIMPEEPRIGAARKGAFGKADGKVRLKQVFRNTYLLEEYFYEKGSLSEVRKYLTDHQKLWQATQYYRRNGWQLTQLEGWAAGITYEAVPIRLEGKQIHKWTNTFLPSVTDSLQSVTDIIGIDSGIEPSKRSLNFSFNAQGYLTQIKRTDSALQEWNDFNRNAQQNVSLFRYVDADQTRNFECHYEYDNHPNPYFYSGRWQEWELDASPNNIVKRVEKRGTTAVTTQYSYTYRPDGLPQKVMIQTNNEPFQQILEFVYYE